MNDFDENTQAEQPETPSEQPAKRGRGRPRKDENRQASPLNVTKETRVPVGGFRKLLNVDVKPDVRNRYHTFWEWDEDDNGVRLWSRYRAGYTHVTKDEIIDAPGDWAVYRTESLGSIVRVPNSKGPGHMYLMKIPHELYNEDRDVIEERNAEMEGIVRETAENLDGSYGSIKFGSDNFN